MEITIIYGTETGNSESLAQDARAKLTKLGHQAKVVDMEGMTVEQLKNAGTLLVITSTWGDGEPPTNAETLHQELKDSSEDLSEVSYAVFALGDEFYENFCQAGKDFDSFLERLKAQRLLPVVLSNGDHDDTFPEWGGCHRGKTLLMFFQDFSHLIFKRALLPGRTPGGSTFS